MTWPSTMGLLALAWVITNFVLWWFGLRPRGWSWHWLVLVGPDAYFWWKDRQGADK